MFYSVISFLSKIVGKIGVSSNRKLTNDERAFFNSNNLTGCLVLTRRKWQFSNFFIKGHYKHSMVFSSSNTVVDSTVSLGTAARHVALLASHSSYEIYRPTFDYEPIEFTQIAYEIADAKIDYDHEHKSGNRLLDCIETTIKIYNRVLVNPIDLDFPIHPIEILDTNLFTSIYKFEEERPNNVYD